MEQLMALVTVLENAQKEHMAGTTNSWTLKCEREALTKLKNMLVESGRIIDGKTVVNISE
jgi:hypothetical protein